MRRITTLLFIASIATTLTAQNEADRQAIKQFCGCFEVEFEYAETFPRTEGYQLAKPYTAEAIEYMVLDEETPGKFVIQNILVMGDTFFIKHWRQDWEFQPSQTFDFQGKSTWETTAVDAKDAKGRWSQEVYEVDHAPRYAGLATWDFTDGKKVWESTADAPLPRREYTKREDYQILRRTNRLLLEGDGWIHEQDNLKVALDGKKERVIVEEKGRNTYHRIDQKKCQAAADWWKKRQWFWKQVRVVWDEFLAKTGTTYTLQKMSGSDFLSDELEKLSNQKFKDEQDAQKAIAKVLDKYRKSSPSTSER